MVRGAIAVLLLGCGSVQDRSDAAGGGADAPVDGSVPDAARPRVVFVTSSFHTGAMGGLSGADAICQQRATTAALPGTYMAWLADATSAPAQRMTQYPSAYQLTNGTVIAQGFADLTDGSLAHEIDRDENGLLSAGRFVCRGGEVWSNVDGDGSIRPGVGSCGGWTSAVLNDGASGNVGNMDLMWTAGDCTPIGCASDLPIYCVQQ